MPKKGIKYDHLKEIRKRRWPRFKNLYDLQGTALLRSSISFDISNNLYYLIQKNVLTGPLPRLRTKASRMFLRTLYLCHVLPLFTKDRFGNYMKPTEGMSKKTAKKLRKLCRKYGGYWIWICSSKSTDIAPKKLQKSYTYGAVFVADVIKTKRFNRKYQKQSLKREYKHSAEYKYQAIIPLHDYARLELVSPIEVHPPMAGEQRWNGLWNANKNTDLVNLLRKPKFI